MKNIICIIIICILFSCNEKQNEEVKVKRKIDPLLEEIFQNRFSNYEDNTLVRDKATEFLTLKIDSLIPLNYLDDIPVEIYKLMKNPHGEGVMVQFKTSDSQKKNVLSDKVSFDIIGFTDDKTASLLIEGNQNYFVFGKYNLRLTKQEVNKLVRYVYNGYDVEIAEDVRDKEYRFNLGNVLVQIDSVRETN